MALGCLRVAELPLESDERRNAANRMKLEFVVRFLEIGLGALESPPPLSSCGLHELLLGHAGLPTDTSKGLAGERAPRSDVDEPEVRESNPHLIKREDRSTGHPRWALMRRSVGPGIELEFEWCQPESTQPTPTRQAATQVPSRYILAWSASVEKIGLRRIAIWEVVHSIQVELDRLAKALPGRLTRLRYRR